MRSFVKWEWGMPLLRRDGSAKLVVVAKQNVARSNGGSCGTRHG